MRNDLVQLEQQLLESLEQRESRFLQALAMAECLPDGLSNGQDCNEVLAQLNTILQEVASLEMSAAMVQSQWTQAGGRPGPKLKSTIERVQKILETLLVHIGQAEQLAEAARNRLVPQIQTEVKARQMRRAYQAAGQPSVAE